MVEIFKTDIRDKEQAGIVIGRLQSTFPDCTFSFHQQGRYIQLRVEIEVISNYDLSRIIDEVTSYGFFCALPWIDLAGQEEAINI